ncbi:hypothetical protein F4780DRAFT_787794 [Xylariomycetidae sp. FL0641]|nr:hypothetical protein F4780DRAFT_787794 [Xylariomycetidae sp. FL0641]
MDDAHQTSNYMPDLQPLLDLQADPAPGARLEVPCQLCGRNKLDISSSARAQHLTKEVLAKCLSSRPGSPASPLARLAPSPGIERTLLLPCGHVFGDRCLRARLVASSSSSSGGGDFACPTCGFRMAYAECGHALAPVLVPVAGHAAIGARVPRTPAAAPARCKQCRWTAVTAKTRHALGAGCALCRAQAAAGIRHDPIAHDVHRVRHVRGECAGIVDAAVALVLPAGDEDEEEEEEEEKDREERRQVNASLLRVLVATSLEDGVWMDTPGRPMEPKAARDHAAALDAVEECLLGWLMEAPGDGRRVW